MSMRVAKVFTWIGLLAMTGGLLNGFVNGDFFVDGQKLFDNPWGIMSLIDLYVGFTLFSLWIFHREQKKSFAVMWTVLMMILGFFTACIYVLIALYTSNDNWNQFFHGDKKV